MQTPSSTEAADETALEVNKFSYDEATEGGDSMLTVTLVKYLASAKHVTQRSILTAAPSTVCRLFSTARIRESRTVALAEIVIPAACNRRLENSV